MSELKTHNVNLDFGDLDAALCSKCGGSCYEPVDEIRIIPALALGNKNPIFTARMVYRCADCKKIQDGPADPSPLNVMRPVPPAAKAKAQQSRIIKP